MEEIYHRFLKIYNKFYNYDLRYSLLVSREYTIIYNFFIVYNISILGTRNSKETLEDLEALENLVNNYTLKLDNIFQTSIKITQPPKIDTNTIYSILIRSDCIFDNFVNSYGCMTKNTNAMYHKVLLIEINNFFSHILSYCNNTAQENNNIKRAIAHLYRGSLDGYKEIIKVHNIIVCASDGLKQSFFEIRAKEGSLIGEKKEENKCSIIEGYKNIANDILTIIS